MLSDWISVANCRINRVLHKTLFWTTKASDYFQSRLVYRSSFSVSDRPINQVIQHDFQDPYTALLAKATKLLEGDLPTFRFNNFNSKSNNSAKSQITNFEIAPI